MRIETPRLWLISTTRESLRAELESPGDLSRVLGEEVPENWPPELYDRDPILWTLDQLEKHPESDGWLLYYVAEKTDADGSLVLVGCGGYKGPPDESGSVEIGYSILAQYRRRGYATEASEGLIRHAFSKPEVTRVIAETLPELEPSIGVLLKCGFRAVEESSAPGVIRYVLKREDCLEA